MDAVRKFPSRQGRRAKISGDGQGTCRKNPTG